MMNNINTLFEKIVLIPLDLYEIFMDYTTDPMGLMNELVMYFSNLI